MSVVCSDNPRIPLSSSVLFLDPRLQTSRTGLIRDSGVSFSHAGFRPRTTRFLRQAQDRPFCFGKRTQNHGARAWPQGVAFAPVPLAWAAELASLRQSSFGTGSPPRPKAPGDGGMRHVLAFPRDAAIQLWRSHVTRDRAPVNQEAFCRRNPTRVSSGRSLPSFPLQSNGYVRHGKGG